MRKDCFVLIFCFVSWAGLLNAQQDTGSARERVGIVMDAKNQEPLLGAAVLVKGSTTGTTCDWDGDGAVTIPPHHTVRVGSGIAVALPEGTFGAVFARSGLASKEGLRPANCVGVVDCDYRGECMVAVHNDSDTDRTIHDGDRIAQMVLLPYLPMEFEEVGELPETARGAGGFGSTGK